MSTSMTPLDRMNERQFKLREHDNVKQNVELIEAFEVFDTTTNDFCSCEYLEHRDWG